MDKSVWADAHKVEGEGEKEGLKQVVEGIEERARQQMFNAPTGQGFGGTTSYSFSIQSSSGCGRYSAGNTVVSSNNRSLSGQSQGGSAVSKLKYQY